MIHLEEKLQNLCIYAKSDEKSAFEEFFYLYQSSVFRFLYRYKVETQATYDILQDTFIKFWEIKEKLDLSSSLHALLDKIARNLVINFVTRKSLILPLYNKNDVLINIWMNPEKEYESAFLMDARNSGLIN